MALVRPFAARRGMVAGLLAAGMVTALLLVQFDAHSADLPTPVPLVSTPLPVEVIAAYYAAINQHDVETVCYHRIKCSDKVRHMVQSNSGINLINAISTSNDGHAATVYTESKENNGDGTYTIWKQNWTLRFIGGRWKIDTTNVVDQYPVGR